MESLSWWVVWARNQGVLARTQAHWGPVKEIGLPDPENLNAHVRPHRTRRGGANPGFRTSRVCPNEWANPVIIFGSEIAVEIRIFPCPLCTIQRLVLCPRIIFLPKDFLMMINSLYKGSIPCSQKHRTQPSSSSFEISLDSSVLPCISGGNKTELFEGLCIASARLQGQRSLNPGG